MNNSVPINQRVATRLVRFVHANALAALICHTGFSASASEGYPPEPQVTKDGTTIWLTNYVRLPASRRGGAITNFNLAPDLANQLARVNFLRSEPANVASAEMRFFVNDLNRNLYILTKSNHTFTAYLNFQAVFPKFDNDPGYAGGLVTFAFDPDYGSNGLFYTVHTEDPALSGSAAPVNTNLPALNLAGYATTAAINPPSGSSFPRQAVLVEWSDTNIANASFEGAARELLRVGFNGNIHPMGDLIFNPLAQPGDTDYQNLYISNGDGGAGENASTRSIPQRLDALQGKILRITPDLSLRPADQLSVNGRYRIPTTGPDPNPFIDLSLAGLKKEIYAYGFRNPHRMSWDTYSATLFADDIGLHAWEEVNIVRKGMNYGYSEREGTEQLFVGGANNGRTGGQVDPPVPFPIVDLLTVTGLVASVAPVYPVAEYSHRDGDAISSGFVYRGSLMPSLRGKYLFGDITTGRLFSSDLSAMLSSDDGDRATLAGVREIQIIFDSPYDNPNRGPVNRRMFDVVAEEYTQRGGNAPGSAALPGSAAVTASDDPDGVPYGGGRADIRLALGGDGEIYVLSKSDGVIRVMAGALAPPVVQSIALTNSAVTLGWQSFPGRSYRVLSQADPTAASWIDVPGDVIAEGTSAFKTLAAPDDWRFYRVVMLP